MRLNRVIDYDICIIELSERIDFSGYDVSPVCIPESKALSKQLVGQKSVIFGLHKTQHLRDVEIRSHSRIYDMKYCGRENNRNLCTQFWKSSPDMYNFVRICKVNNCTGAKLIMRNYSILSGLHWVTFNDFHEIWPNASSWSTVGQ